MEMEAELSDFKEKFTLTKEDEFSLLLKKKSLHLFPIPFSHDFAKLSPNFSFSWAEMVFNLHLPYPPTRGKYQNGQIKLNIVKQN